jgi:hypothetical protein
MTARISVKLLVLFAALALAPPGTQSVARCQQLSHTIDARYAPSPSYSLLCYPHDPLKTVVTGAGELGYDFGPGPYAHPLTSIGFSLLNDSVSFQRQWLEDARVPLVCTELIGQTGSLTTHALSWGGPQEFSTGGWIDGRYRRVGGVNGCIAWANPLQGKVRDLRNVAWGTGRPILYRVKVSPGAKKRVAVGFCESYKRSSKSRVLEIHIEGSPSLPVDPMPNGVKNEPVIAFADGEDANKDGELAIEVHPLPGGADANAILNAIWVFDAGAHTTASDLLGGTAADKAELTIRCGEDLEHRGRFSRVDMFTAEIKGSQASPVVQYRSRREILKREVGGNIHLEGTMVLHTNPQAASIREVQGGFDLLFPAGTAKVDVLVGFGDPPPSGFPTIPPLALAEKQLKKWWIDSSAIPFGRITVPDPSIQYLLDAGVRTTYQVADRLDGAQQFQPGPSVYRGLWVGDLGVLWITALMLGDTSATREFVDVVSRRQEPNGQVRVMVPIPALAETPLLLFGIVQYARATGDLRWLQDRYGSIRDAVRWIRQTRESSLSDPGAIYAGLVPPGFVDGGISTPATDYGTVLWMMIGLEHAIDAACMLDRSAEAREWSDLLEQFKQSLHKAIERDAKPDSGDALFLPVTVGNTVKAPPQQGMASQVLPVPFGAFYEQDTLMQRTVRGFLQCVDRRQEQGIPVGVGWMANGLWPSWFGPFEVVDHMLYGDRARGYELLYAIANHATSAGTWAEEQLPKRMGPGISGDMANAQSAATFVFAVRWMIARERSNDLELLPTVPPEWLKAGAVVALSNNNGRFGPFSIRCEVDASGKKARVQVSAPPGRGSKGHVRLMLESFRKAGFSRLNGERMPDKQLLQWDTPSLFEFQRD